jgi:isoleucyl-tRNA synthetase
MKAAEQVQEKGIEYWRQASVSDLAKSVQCPQCFNTDFAKEQDILDVWFESGVSHFAVLYKNPAAGFPADLYLEGIDQHRAWFQSSLLTSLVLEGQSCTKAILSHGFTVDEKGHKMSKSLGNVVTPTEIIEKVGTDGLRLWASSVDYDGDAIVSDVLLRNVAEVYRKMRNTARFLLSNLNDFDKEKDEIALSKMLLIDRYALEQLFHVNYRIRKAYLTYNFTAVFHELAEYCTTELSSFYLDVIKDRLYVEKADGIMRRSAQTACWYILDTLTRAIAPILSFTAEQISDMYQPNKLTSIHLQPFADLTDVWNMMISRSPVDAQSAIDWYPLKGGVVDAADAIKKMAFHAERTAQWEILLAIRSVILKELELLREKGIIKHSLEAQVTLYIDFSDKDMEKLRNFFAPLDQSVQSKEEFFKEFFIVSQYHRAKSKEGLKHSEELPGLWLNIARAAGEKCPRCWQWDISDHPDNLCRRCQQILAQ